MRERRDVYGLVDQLYLTRRTSQVLSNQDYDAIHKMKRKNISKDEVRADLADAKRLRFLRQPPRYGQYDGDLPVMLYLMKLDVVTPGSHVLGIKRIVPGTGIDSKPRVKWHYCSVAENGECRFLSGRESTPRQT